MRRLLLPLWALLALPLWIWCSQAWGLGFLMLLELGGAVTTGCILHFCERKDCYFSLRMGLLAFFFPGVGTLGGWLFALFGNTSSPRALEGLYEGNTETIQNWGAFDPMEAMRSELSVRAAIDELRYGELFAKQWAANYLAESEDQEGVRLLRESLSDEDPDTRLFSSLSILKLEEKHTARIQAARLELAEASTPDPARRELAEAISHYLASGVPSQGIAEGLSKELAVCANRMEPAENPQAALFLFQALRGMGKHRDALAAARQAHRLEPLEVQFLLAYCQALYECGEFDQLQEASKKLVDRALPGSPAHEVALYWTRADG